MLRTPVCDLLDIVVPIVQGPIGPATTPELVAAVSNAGGLGSLTAVLESAESVRNQIERTRGLTNNPFAVNHLLNMLDEDAFAATIDARPAVVSFALGDPGERVALAHDAGIQVMHQVVTVEAAYQSAELGVDVIIAQGGEAGGNSGAISTLTLTPQVVEAVAPIPVLVAGGIADGRGMAAALALGAQGVNLGTRFLAAQEAGSGEVWQQAIVNAESSDILKFSTWNMAFPPAGGAYATVPSAIRTPFIDDWLTRESSGAVDADAFRNEIINAAGEGRFAELVPLAGQSSGLITEVLPAAEIIEQMCQQAEWILRSLSAIVAE